MLFQVRAFDKHKSNLITSLKIIIEKKPKNSGGTYFPYIVQFRLNFAHKLKISLVIWNNRTKCIALNEQMKFSQIYLVSKMESFEKGKKRTLKYL